MASRLKVPQRAPPRVPSRRQDPPHGGDQEQSLLCSNGDVALVDGRAKASEQSLSVYRDVLTALLRRTSIDYSHLLRLADFRKEHHITESEHFAALADLGESKEGFAQRIKNGQRAPEIPPPSSQAEDIPRATPPTVEGENGDNGASHRPPPPVVKQSVKIEHSCWSSMVLWCAVVTGALLGLFVRIGTGFLDVARDDTDSSVLYANILGSLVMGFVTTHEKYQHQSRTHHIVYVAITSGFCGSLTTFSALNAEAVKILFQQLDSMSQDASAGNFVWQWIVYLWGGVVIPLAALRLGQHMARLFRCRPQPEKRRQHVFWAELVLFFMFIVTLIMVFTLPLVHSPARKHFVYAAAMGGAGALLRYFLSACLNPLYSGFPLGTFLCNTIATAILVAVFVAQFSVHPTNLGTLSVCYGVMVGLCGCLSTMSSFVNELHKLGIVGVKNAYVYGLTTVFVSQLIALLIFFLVARAQILSYIWPSPLDFCEAYNSTCYTALRVAGCPPSETEVISCANPSQGLNSFVGTCKCGEWDVGVQVAESLINSQVELNAPNCLVSVWPSDSRSVPTHTYDFCASFDRICTDALSRVGCPDDLQSRDACGGLSLDGFLGVCNCGKLSFGTHVPELLVGAMLANRPHDLIEWEWNVALPAINLCEAYADICAKILGHIQCPDGWRHVIGCHNSSDMASFIGKCQCGDRLGFLSDYVNGLVVDTQMKTRVPVALQRISPQSMSTFEESPFDMCVSFEFICAEFLNRIECPHEQRELQACNTSMTQWMGQCACGANEKFPGHRISELLIDAILLPHLNAYLYDPPRGNPYQELAFSGILP